jgi:chromosome segregation ATPase
VTLTSGIKSGASAYCDQIPLIWRKDQALKDLTEKKKISRELYEELHNNFDGALSQLKTEAQNLIEEIEKQLVRFGEERRQLNYALVHLEIEHEIGKIDNQSYDTAFTIIQESLKQANDEKSDLELMKSRLSNILLGEAPKMTEQDKSKEKPKTTVPAASAYELPEPPVVVYVKEIGRTGI